MGLYLEREGMRWEAVATAEDALERMAKREYDLIVLDINLPGMDGFEFLRQIRRTRTVPVVVVSSRTSDEDLVRGLGVGADEFVVKPFSPKVLVARVSAHLRRARHGDTSPPVVFGFGGFTYDVEACMLAKGGTRVPMAAREIDLLGCLLRASPKTVSVEELYRTVWGNKFGERGTVAVHVQRVRQKIEADPSEPRFILNVYGKGYLFNPDALERVGPEGDP